MGAIISISFYDEQSVQFDLKTFPVVEKECEEIFSVNEIFFLLNSQELRVFYLAVQKQLNEFLSRYSEPNPIENSRFDHQWIILIGGAELRLSKEDPEHFLIHMCVDILDETSKSIHNSQVAGVVVRNNFVDDYHFALVHKIIHFISKGQSNAIEIQKLLQDEFSNTLSNQFISETISDLVRLGIIKINSTELVKGEYFLLFN